MAYPVRCFDCNAVIGHLRDAYVVGTSSGAEPRALLDRLGLVRECCRTHMIACVDTSNMLTRFPPDRFAVRSYDFHATAEGRAVPPLYAGEFMAFVPQSASSPQ